MCRLFDYKSLTEKDLSIIEKLTTLYETSIVIRAIEIGYNQYIVKDRHNNVTPSSKKEFFNKLQGIAYNLCLPPEEQKIKHILNSIKYANHDWSISQTNEYLHHLLSDPLCMKLDRETICELLERARAGIYHVENFEDWINDVYCLFLNEAWERPTFRTNLIYIL